MYTAAEQELKFSNYQFGQDAHIAQWYTDKIVAVIITLSKCKGLCRTKQSYKGPETMEC